MSWGGTSKVMLRCGTNNSRWHPAHIPMYCTAAERQTAVTAYCTRKQLLLFAFVLQYAAVLYSVDCVRFCSRFKPTYGFCREFIGLDDPYIAHRYWPNIGLMLAQLGRRWANINSTLGHSMSCVWCDIHGNLALHILFITIVMWLILISIQPWIAP